MDNFGIYSAFLRAITFRPIRREGFDALQASTYGAIVIGLLFAALAETLAVHLAMAYYLSAEWQFVHVIVGVIHASSIAWIIGDWRLMKETGHRVDDDTLEIDLGQRWSGRIPLSSIIDVRLGEVATPDILQGEKLPEHVVAVTPFDAPNLTLSLSEPVTVRTYFGIERTGTEVQLFVSQPAELRDSLRANLPAAG